MTAPAPARFYQSRGSNNAIVAINKQALITQINKATGKASNKGRPQDRVDFLSRG